MRKPSILIGVLAGVVWNGSPASSAPPTGAAKALPLFARPQEITHPYLPLASLKQDVYEGKVGARKLRLERTARPELRKRFKVGGEVVTALGVENRAYVDGTLARAMVEYLAQADDGAVYRLGVGVDQYINRQVSGHAGSWLLGVDAKAPDVVLPAKPKVGDRFRSAGGPKAAREEDEVVSVSEKVTVPAGSFANCLVTRAIFPDGRVERRYYAEGVGCVKVAWDRGELLLTARNTTATAKDVTAARPAAPSPVAPAPGNTDPPLADPMARVALGFVGADPLAEQYWLAAINDPRLSGHERQDLIEDLNEVGFADPHHPSPDELPLILNRLALIEALAPFAMDRVNADAFQEAYKDLTKMAGSLTGQTKPK